MTGVSVVSYRNSTSNHNPPRPALRLLLLYLIEILHQTTTHPLPFWVPLGCILSKFYIKPQQDELTQDYNECCILSKFYIKPQQNGRHIRSP